MEQNTTGGEEHLAEEVKIDSLPKMELPQNEFPKPVSFAEVPLLPAPKRHFVRWLVIAVIGIIVLALVYYFRGMFVAALIDGSPISRLSVVRELENQSGAQVLDALINQHIVEQKAAEKGISISEEEIDQALNGIRENLASQNTTLEEALKAQNLTMEQVRSNIRLQKLAERLVEDKLTVSDEEVNAYLEQNKDFLPPADSLESQRTTVRDMLRQQKFASVFQEWLTAVKAEADISYWKEY
ncbi:MAG: parvulin-like peptidyl-prolyl isomerase [Parcubacteria group bacterium Gr01-1014_70]|nr:MAG: parvulin-like peptidyl-prolyl isomerase [Parcubacteria group bacterium Gr01-1014_70]